MISGSNGNKIKKLLNFTNFGYTFSKFARLNVQKSFLPKNLTSFENLSPPLFFEITLNTKFEKV